MKQQLSPNAWSCLPTSFAMVMNVDVTILIDALGHDGSTIYWPDLPPPKDRRGFHIQEMIDWTFQQGQYVVPFQARPTYRPVDDVPIRIAQTKLSPDERMEMAMLYEGVITGETIDGQAHAVAWNGKTLLDPGRRISHIEEFIIDTFWAILG